MHDLVALQRPWLDEHYRSWVTFADGRVQRSEIRAILTKAQWGLLDLAVDLGVTYRWPTVSAFIEQGRVERSVSAWDEMVLEKQTELDGKFHLEGQRIELVIHDFEISEREVWYCRKKQLEFDTVPAEISARKVAEAVEQRISVVDYKKSLVGMTLIMAQDPIVLQRDTPGEFMVVCSALLRK